MMLKRTVSTLICFIVCIGVSTVYAAEREGHVCSSDFVSKQIGKSSWVILDGRDGDDYQEGHIPGAVNYGKPVVVVLKHPIDGKIVSVEEAEHQLGKIGLDNNKGLIIYGKKADYHVTVEQLPIYLGVKDYCYLDGGYEGWVKSGKKVEKNIVKPVPAIFKAKISDPHFYTTTEELIGIVNNQTPKVSIIDVRSPKEFAGSENTAIRGGRVPGSVNVPVELNLDADGKFLPKEKLAELYKQFPKDHKIILLCHRGCRTAYSYYALENLGYKDISIYEDGYIAWSTRSDTPIENEHFINMRSIVTSTATSKKRLDELEDAVLSLVATVDSQKKKLDVFEKNKNKKR